MLTIHAHQIQGRNIYKRPSPGFKALRGEAEVGSLTRVYNTGVAFSVPVHKDLSLAEIKRMERKLDRMHDFHLGQAMSFTLLAKNVLREADSFNPGLAVQKLRDALVEMNADLDKYAKFCDVQQFTLDDQAVYNAQLQQAESLIGHSTHG